MVLRLSKHIVTKRIRLNEPRNFKNILTVSSVSLSMLSSIQDECLLDRKEGEFG